MPSSAYSRKSVSTGSLFVRTPSVCPSFKRWYLAGRGTGLCWAPKEAWGLWQRKSREDEVQSIHQASQTGQRGSLPHNTTSNFLGNPLPLKKMKSPFMIYYSLFQAINYRYTHSTQTSVISLIKNNLALSIWHLVRKKLANSTCKANMHIAQRVEVLAWELDVRIFGCCIDRLKLVKKGWYCMWGQSKSRTQGPWLEM